MLRLVVVVYVRVTLVGLPLRSGYFVVVIVRLICWITFTFTVTTFTFTFTFTLRYTDYVYVYILFDVGCVGCCLRTVVTFTVDRSRFPHTFGCWLRSTRLILLIYVILFAHVWFDSHDHVTFVRWLILRDFGFVCPFGWRLDFTFVTLDYVLVTVYGYVATLLGYAVVYVYVTFVWLRSCVYTFGLRSFPGCCLFICLYGC